MPTPLHTASIVLVAASVATLARPAAAAVALVSAEITRDDKTLTAGPIFSEPPPVPEITHTVTGPYAFPNDADNFVRVGAEGLTVGADFSGTFSHGIGNFLNESAHDYRFRVVFDVDEPAPYTYSQAFTAQQITFDGTAVLQRDGDAPVSLLYNGSGTLAPGRYTFSGDTDLVRMVGMSGLPQFYITNINFGDVRLTVAPEPSALSLLLVGGALICRRRR